jgi:hypothetical protein
MLLDTFCDRLKMSGWNLKESNVQEALHSLLYSLLFIEYPPKKQQHFDCPLGCFLLVVNWLPSGAFKEPNTITQTFVAVQFVARCVAGQKCIAVADNSESEKGPFGYVLTVLARNYMLILCVQCGRGFLTPLEIWTAYTYWQPVCTVGNY